MNYLIKKTETLKILGCTIFMVTSLFVATLGRSGVVEAQPVTNTPNQVTSTGSNRDYSGLVKCDGFIKDENNQPIPGQVECNLAAIISIVQALISWFFGISGSLAALLFMYGGVLYLSNNPSNIEKARKIFTNTALGISIIAVAWLFVRTILDLVVDTKYLPILTNFFGN